MFWVKLVSNVYDSLNWHFWQTFQITVQTFQVRVCSLRVCNLLNILTIVFHRTLLNDSSTVNFCQKTIFFLRVFRKAGSAKLLPGFVEKDASCVFPLFLAGTVPVLASETEEEPWNNNKVLIIFHLKREKNLLPAFIDVFSRRFSSEECPNLTVASLFFVRLQSHSDWATFLTINTTKTTTIRPSPVSGN